MRAILVPYHDFDSSAPSLDLALAVVRAAGGNRGFIQGMHVKQQLPVIAGEGITLPGDYIAQLGEQSEAQAKKSRADFVRQAGELGLREGEVDSAAAETVYSWREFEGAEMQIIGEYSRLFDAVALSRTPGLVDWRTVCEAALFESGRPVLLAGARPPGDILHRVVLVWNRSTETARTAAMTVNLLRAAARVMVLEVHGATVSGPDGKTLCAHLVGDGVKAELREMELGDAQPGAAILKAAGEFNATLLIKGAYTHSRLRQLIFGGATREVIDQAGIPLLLAH